MRNVSTILRAALALAAVLTPATLPANATKPEQQLAELIAATSLDRDGTAPWHLRISFRLYDLDGKPAEKGTIEEWWVNQQQYRIAVSSPSYNASLSQAPEDPVVASRTAFLVKNLLEQFIHPIPRYENLRELDIFRSNQKLDKVELSCLTPDLSPLMRAGSAERRMAMAYADGRLAFDRPSSFCVEPGTTVLRAQFQPNFGYLAVRDQLATFRGVEIAVDTGISFGGRLAITGHLEALEGYTPKPEELATTAAPGHNPTITPGKLLASADLSGKGVDGAAVVVIAISRSGTVDSVDVVCRTKGDFANAAADAIKKWKFAPALREGKPIPVMYSIAIGRGMSFGD